MAEVSIDIDAMADLVSSLGAAKSDLAGASGSLKGNLTSVWLSNPGLSAVDGLEGEIESAVRDLNRRLALARVIQQSTPGMSVVSFDDSVLSTADAAEVQRRVDRVMELLKVDDDDFERDVDEELAKLLSENSLDPYFAKGLAEKLSPEGLDQYLNLVNQKRQFMSREGEEATKEFDERYDQILRGLGESLGLASRGTGDVGVPGMTEKWTDFIEERGDLRTGSVNRLSLVIERGQWSDDFITGIYRSMREMEGDDGPEVWAGIGGMVFDPDLEKSPGARIIDDPMYGVMRAMRHNPDAIRELFTTGDTTDLQVSDDEKVAVNKELYDFLRHRDGMSDDAAEAFMNAMATAIGSPPKLGAPAFQPMLADDLKNIGDALQHEADVAEEEAGPLWAQIGHGLLDIVGMVPVIGEPVDFVNGIWTTPTAT